MALTEHALERIKAIDPLINSFVTADARERAGRCRDARMRDFAKGIDKGPMHGIPYALKDIYGTAGIRTTCHSKLLLDNVPTDDCVVAAKFKAQGAVMLGKLGTHEFAIGGPSLRPAVPAGAQPVESGSLHRRLVVRIGRGGRRRHRAHGDGLRHRRLDPRARRLLRHGRAEADLRPRLAPRRVSALLHARSLRSAVMDGRGQRASPCR